MSEESEKPKKIKDIRERLGRPTTRTPPKTEGGDVVPPPPSMVPGKPGTRPPSMGHGRGAPSDPFQSAVPAAGHQQVRIVVDEEAVAEHHEGRSKRDRKLMAVAGSIALALGLVLGALAHNVIQDRAQYNRSARDGKEIYQSVRDASDQVAQAKALVDRARGAANPTIGATPAVDYQALEALRAMEIPFTAAHFSNKWLVKFNRETVDALVTYAREVNEVWAQFDKLANRSLPPARRAELEAAAKDEHAVTATATGCVPTLGQGGMRCGLVYVDMPEEQGATKAQVRAVRSGRAVEKEIYSGQDLRSNPTTYVILTNPEMSKGVLGQQQNAFVTYRKELGQLSKLVDQLTQTQGRLETELGNIATLQELGGI